MKYTLLKNHFIVSRQRKTLTSRLNEEIWSQTSRIDRFWISVEWDETFNRYQTIYYIIMLLD